MGQKPSESERKQAKKALAGILGMQMGLAGAAGLPLSGLLMGMSQLLSDIGGDDDDPFLVEAELRQAVTTALVDVFGDDVGKYMSDAMTNGIINASTPFNLSSRISHNDLVYRSSDRDLDSDTDYLNFLKQLGGVSTSYIEIPFLVGEHLRNENYSKAAESMMPKFMKDALKAVRYGVEDARTRSGYLVKDMTPQEIVSQLIGFSSSELSDQYSMTNSRANLENRLKYRRSVLLDHMIQAMNGDGNVAEAQKAINKWNMANPNNRITKTTIKQSMGARDRYKSKLQEGKYTTARYQDKNDKFDWAS